MFFKVSFDTIMTGHQNYKNFVLTRCTAGLGSAAGAHFWPENMHFLRYAYITPIFLGQTDLTQWGHISLIS